MQANFTPGPSQLYFTVTDHVKRAFRDGIPSLSHRTPAFEGIFASATTGLRALLGIPESFRIVFVSSATEIWERSIQNLVEETSLHFVNGAFSKRYYEVAHQLKKKPSKIEVPEGSGFQSIEFAGNPELIALTHNETSTGVALPVSFVNSFRTRYPQAIIAVDAVSSLPYPSFDFAAIDSLFFSVQKGFGLPAGLGVWIVNERCIGKSENMLSAGFDIGSYHNLPTLISFAKKRQTPETPNVLGMYLLAKVVDDFLHRGIHALRKETEYRAALLYNWLDSAEIARPFVTEKSIRSSTVVVMECEKTMNKILPALQARGLFPGDGYGKARTSQLRFANFPAHSKEQYELLVDTLDGLQNNSLPGF
jgi:phosphoserine aminotransferase